jgi:hypothetical protein
MVLHVVFFKGNFVRRRREGQGKKQACAATEADYSASFKRLGVRGRGGLTTATQDELEMWEMIMARSDDHLPHDYFFRQRGGGTCQRIVTKESQRGERMYGEV